MDEEKFPSPLVKILICSVSRWAGSCWVIKFLDWRTKIFLLRSHVRKRKIDPDISLLSAIFNAISLESTKEVLGTLGVFHLGTTSCKAAGRLRSQLWPLTFNLRGQVEDLHSEVTLLQMPHTEGQIMCCRCHLSPRRLKNVFWLFYLFSIPAMKVRHDHR